jgi:hypothetical protein
MSDCWKSTMQKLGPGVYVDDRGALHLDAGELLAVNGYHATAENSAMLLKVAREVAAEHGAILHEV